jgi:hypothetical protein
MIWAPKKKFAEEVIEECAAFPYGDHDDLVDSTTQAIMRFRQGGLIDHPEDYVDEVVEKKQRSILLMPDFKIDYKLTAPQTYDRGDVGEKNTKLSRDTQRGTVTVTAPNIEEANKKAKPIIKNSKTFNNFSSRQSFDSPRKTKY